MVFKHWSQCTQDVVFLELDTNKLYYLHAQAWHLKGYLGGTHSWLAFWHRDRWLTVELSDRETLSCQRSYDNKPVTIYNDPGTVDIQTRAPFISDRITNAQWFGHNPRIVDSCYYSGGLKDIQSTVDQYPIKDFNIISKNCNTFTSYMIYKLCLPLRRPVFSYGFKGTKQWTKYNNVSIYN